MDEWNNYQTKKTCNIFFKLNDGRIVKRHQNQIRNKYDNVLEEQLDMSDILDIEILSDPETTTIHRTINIKTKCKYENTKC